MPEVEVPRMDQPIDQVILNPLGDLDVRLLLAGRLDVPVRGHEREFDH